MKLLFSLGLFLGSLAFTLYGLSTLDLTDTLGRPGPGYFPLIIGSMLLITTGISSYQEYRKTYGGSGSVSNNTTHENISVNKKHYAFDTLLVALLIALFLFTLKPLGSILSMILFTACFLVYFNKGQHKLNLVYSILLPLGVYLLFDILLRAGLPKGIFD